MSNTAQVDKDRLLFTQCNDTILLRCPECTTRKILRHCKTFHNFPAVWCHIIRDHPEIIEFRRKEIIQVFNNLFQAYKWNMFPKWAYSEAKIPSTTTSSLEFDGRPSRIDVFERLIEIGRLFKGQTQFYPNLTLKQIERWSLVILKNVDARTQKKYVDCVRKYSKKDIVKGEYNVTGFCDTVGV